MLVITSVGAAISGLFFGPIDPAIVIRGFSAIVLAAILYAAVPSWSAFIYALMLCMIVLFSATGLKGEWALLSYELSPGQMPFIAALLLGLAFGPSFQIVSHWDKVLILRMGRFHKVKGPGLIFLAPLIDRCAAVVDTRIRVTDFSAERILTRDTVPIHVDALA
ncbi:MAG: slipin family protein, partial [Spirochaetales bacterium]